MLAQMLAFFRDVGTCTNSTCRVMGSRAGERDEADQTNQRKLNRLSFLLRNRVVFRWGGRGVWAGLILVVCVPMNNLQAGSPSSVGWLWPAGGPASLGAEAGLQ